MAIKNLRIFFLFVLVTGFVEAKAGLHLAMRRMYVVSAETQDHVLYVDHIYAIFAQQLTTSEHYTYIPVDSIQAFLGKVLLSDFTVKISPQQLLNVEHKFGLQVVLFFFIQKIQEDYHLYIKAVEFPSDVFISDLDIRLSLNVEDIPGIMRKLESFVDMIRMNAQQQLGYSFPDSESGILFLTDDKTLPPLFSTLGGAARAQAILQDYKNDLRTKVRLYNFKKWPIQPEHADSLLELMNAQVLLLFSRQSEQVHVFFPTRIGKVSILENTLPLWPPYDGFQKFILNPDSSYGYALANSLFPQSYGAIGQLLQEWQGQGDAAKSLFLKNIQTLQKSQTTTRFENNKALSDLYAALAELYWEKDKEFGWIKLNHAALLKEMGELVSSLDASQAALTNFQEALNTFGRLFALVQSGDTCERLGRMNNAVEAYQNALTFAKMIENEHTTAYCYYRLGTIKFNDNKLIEAWDFFDNSADSYMHVGDTLKAVQLYTKLGILMRQSNFSIKSSEYLKHAVVLATNLDSDREVADAGYHLAVTLEERGEADSALAFFQRTGDLMEILADTIGLANTEEHIGDILFTREEWKDAQLHFEYAARFYKYIPDIEGIIRSLVKTADASASRKRWLRAQNDYDEALQFANLYEKTDWVSIVIYKKGLAHVREGKYALGQEELALARQGDVSPEVIQSYMKSFIRELEQELESRNPDSRP